MLTFEDAINEFLHVQKTTLQPRTYAGYRSVMDIFTIYLDDYGHNELFGDELEEYEVEQGKGGKSFSQIVGADKLDEGYLTTFLRDFIIRKVAAGATFMQDAVRVMKKFIKWLKEEGHIEAGQEDGLIDFFSR